MNPSHSSSTFASSIPPACELLGKKGKVMQNWEYLILVFKRNWTGSNSEKWGNQTICFPLLASSFPAASDMLTKEERYARNVDVCVLKVIGHEKIIWTARNSWNQIILSLFLLPLFLPPFRLLVTHVGKKALQKINVGSRVYKNLE